jgi:hypothetical protein
MKRPYFFVILAWITLAYPTPTSADELGRLFFTPEQRSQRELAQKNAGSADSPRAISVNGVVQKNGGKRTVWINGTAQLVDPKEGHAPENVLISLPGLVSQATLKVGQRLFLNPPPADAPH